MSRELCLFHVGNHISLIFVFYSSFLRILFGKQNTMVSFLRIPDFPFIATRTNPPLISVKLFMPKTLVTCW